MEISLVCGQPAVLLSVGSSRRITATQIVPKAVCGIPLVVGLALAPLLNTKVDERSPSVEDHAGVVMHVITNTNAAAQEVQIVTQNMPPAYRQAMEQESAARHHQTIWIAERK